jgi:hypothetical protein
MELEYAQLVELHNDLENRLKIIKAELRERDKAIRKCKDIKIFSWIKKEFNIKNLCSIRYNFIEFYFGKNKKVCECYFRENVQITIELPKYYYLHYIYNDGFISDEYAEHKVMADKFLADHPILFDNIKHVYLNKEKIFKRYQTYHNMFYEHNYLNVLTFLLCNRQTKIFPYGIDTIISKKIF